MHKYVVNVAINIAAIYRQKKRVIAQNETHALKAKLCLAGNMSSKSEMKRANNKRKLAKLSKHIAGEASRVGVMLLANIAHVKHNSAASKHPYTNHRRARQYAASTS